MSAISNFHNKMKWRMHLGGTPVWYSNFRAPEPAAKFRGICAPEINAFCSAAQHELHNKVGKAIGTNDSRDISYLRFHRYAFRWLKANDVHVALSDKDGGCVLVDNSDVEEQVLAKLVSPTYIRVSEQDFRPLVFKKIMHGCVSKICAALDDKDLAKHLHSNLGSGNWSKVAGNVLHTVKTHKDPGEVSFRIIHSGFGNPTAPVAKYLAHFLKVSNNKLAFLHRSSDSVLGSVQSGRYPSDLVFYKADVKDFYMQGTLGFHRMHAFNDISPDKVRDSMKDCLETIL